MSTNRTIGSVSEYIYLLDLNPDPLKKVPVYRGEPTLYDLPCEPKAFRAGSTYRAAKPFNLLDPISTSVSKWKRDVTLAEGAALNTSTQLEDMILAQHYGVATRLLDWSTNPLVALWFAATYKKEETGYVYTFNAPAEFLELTGESYSNLDDNSDRYNALNKNPYNFDENMGPRPQYSQFKELHFFRPTYLPDARVLAQSGVISLHPKPDAFDLAKLTCTFEIPVGSKHQVKRELDTLGINFRTLGLATRESIAHTVNNSDIVF